MFPLLFLGNGWADCFEIWYALGNPLVTSYAVVTDEVSLHVRTCTPRFCISQTARPIEFNFGVRVRGHELNAYHMSWVGYLCTCARENTKKFGDKNTKYRFGIGIFLVYQIFCFRLTSLVSLLQNTKSIFVLELSHTHRAELLDLFSGYGTRRVL